MLLAFAGAMYGLVTTDDLVLLENGVEVTPEEAAALSASYRQTVPQDVCVLEETLRNVDVTSLEQRVSSIEGTMQDLYQNLQKVVRGEQ